MSEHPSDPAPARQGAAKRPERGAGSLMIIGLVCFFGSAGMRYALAEPAAWKTPILAGCALGVALYVFGWAAAFRAKHNADWFSRALNILGGGLFLVFAVLIAIGIWRGGS